MKKPATPEQAPQLGGKKSSPVAPIVITLLIIFVGMPILLAIVGVIFVSANFDKITAFADKYSDLYYPYGQNYYVMDDARIKAAADVYALSYDSHLREAGLAKVDCENLSILAKKLGDDFISKKACDAKEIEIGSELRVNSIARLYLSDGDTCVEYQFYGNFTKLINYKEHSSSSACDDLHKVKLVDTGEESTQIKELDQVKFDTDKNSKENKA